MRNPYELFELFSVDPRHQGAIDFSELCYRLNAAELGLELPDMGSMGGIIRFMMRERRVSAKLFYSRMKAALRPMLEADEATLEALGLRPERRTSTAMAVAVAAWMVAADE